MKIDMEKCENNLEGHFRTLIQCRNVYLHQSHVEEFKKKISLNLIFNIA